MSSLPTLVAWMISPLPILTASSTFLILYSPISSFVICVHDGLAVGRCEDPGWLLPLRLAKKGQDGWAHPGSVGEASWEAPLPIAAGGQLLYLMLRCFAACCC